MSERYHAIIMAGGIGSRFWPLSRNHKPKQFLDILGTGQSLIQMTYQRLLGCVPKENIWVVSHVDYQELIQQQLTEIKAENILLEPFRKNTAPCLIYASHIIKNRNPDAILFIAPSDHLIINESIFINDVLSSFKFLELYPQYLLTFGIQASRPDTGFGYIQYNSNQQLGDEIYQVLKFVEKPDHNTAIQYIQQGNFVWNSGMFLWSCQTFINEIKKHEPTLYEIFNQSDIQLELKTIYEQCHSVSIDYALMERSDQVVTKTVDFGWSDLGTWGSLYELKNHDPDQNSLQGPSILINETSNCLIENNGKQLIAVQGLDNFIVVNTEDVLLICQKSSEQKIKDLVKKLEEINSKKFT